MNTRNCKGCERPIPKKKRSDALYCSDTCCGAAQKRKDRERKGLTARPPRGPYKVARKDYVSRRKQNASVSARKYSQIVASRVGKPTIRQEAVALGFRSGFERTLATSLSHRKMKFGYETLKLPYTIHHNYSPDFVLPNGILIEAKGKLTPQDRSKMIAVKQQHPLLDIRFVFMRGENTLTKGSKTTYMMWAAKNGFPAADGEIPDEWLT